MKSKKSILKALAAFISLCMLLAMIPAAAFAEETTAQTMPFTDVEEGLFYSDPVLWAYENEITTGTTDTTFSPDNYCLRGQVITFIWRAAGKPGHTSTENPFTDVTENDFFYDAVLWALENEITTGTTDTTFSPNSTCLRGQAVTFLWRAAGKPEPAVTENPFTDVVEDEFYYDAVLWALENNITTGTTDTTFSPNNYCLRGQVVTFLYRASQIQPEPEEDCVELVSGDTTIQVPSKDIAALANEEGKVALTDILTANGIDPSELDLCHVNFYAGSDGFNSSIDADYLEEMAIANTSETEGTYNWKVQASENIQSGFLRVSGVTRITLNEHSYDENTHLCTNGLSVGKDKATNTPIFAACGAADPSAAGILLQVNGSSQCVIADSEAAALAGEDGKILLTSILTAKGIDVSELDLCHVNFLAASDGFNSSIDADYLEEMAIANTSETEGTYNWRVQASENIQSGFLRVSGVTQINIVEHVYDEETHLCTNGLSAGKDKATNTPIFEACGAADPAYAS